MQKRTFKKLRDLPKRARTLISVSSVTLVASALLMFFEGIDDKTSIELYLQKLQSLSEYRIGNDQKYLVTNYYLQNKNRNPNVRHRHKIRATFNSHKNKLKQEWCTHYSLKWPTEHYQITINNKPEHARAFQAHHIVPINAGGINQWWNLSPISDKNHHELHSSIEEHACFSHDFIEQKTCRLMLKIKEVFCGFTTKSPCRRGVNTSQSTERYASICR